MRKRIRLTESDLNKIIKDAVNEALMGLPYYIRNYDEIVNCTEEDEKAAFADAINNIQNGGRWSDWIKRHQHVDPWLAEHIYCEAERYVQELEQNDERLNVQPHKTYGYNGEHYSGENMNVHDTNGRFSMDILGNGSRFRGVQAIKRGSDMDIEDAMKEYDRLNNR